MRLTDLFDLARPLKVPILAAYVAWILGLMLLPVPATAGSLPAWSDKVVHFAVFVPLPLLVAVLRPPSWRARFVGWAVGAALAALIEVVQARLAFRSGDLWDFVWGTIGATVGVATALAYDRLVRTPPAGPPDP